MSRFKLVATNLVTAVVTAAVTSAFWIAAYGNGDRKGVEAAGDKVALDKPDVELAEGLVVGPTGLAIPVAGLKADQLVDTYTQARAGGARVHDAIDIMAPAGTPVLAAAPGTVEKLFFSKGGGGVTVYVRSPDKRWIYYYAHLPRYVPGLK
ncbi:MAG TPA: peptidoglycan DD-metalloendopeptidase family protein, partial [Allosphingosinicella sp.]|nr:peptidoglycan DD-metalloendopeptidase family protein [Allosphingosinicella sp.]